VRVGVYVGNQSPEVGGGFTIVSELIAALRSSDRPAGHEFVVLTTAEVTPTANVGLEVLSLRDAVLQRPAVQRLEGKLHRGYARMLGHPRRPDGAIAPNAAVEALLSASKIDVIWYLSAWDCCTLEIPYVTVVWDLQHRLQPYWPEVSDDGKWDYRERWMSTMLRRASLVVTGTAAGSEEVERFYGVSPQRIRAIPHPTPTFIERFGAQPVPRVVEGDYIFYPAQFWPHKNHANLLHALRQLREGGMDVSLALTGSDQGNRAFVESLAAELGVAPHVKMLGFVSEAQLVSLYRHALALTYVTFFGPENLPPLEAFAAGCPVVASDVSGAREQMGDAALLVDPRSPEQMAAAVRSVHTDAVLRARMIEAGRARARRSTPASFVREVCTWLDEFAPVRRCWPSGAYQAGKGRWP